VIAAPTHTSFHCISASGSTLNIPAKSRVITPNEIAALRPVSSASDTPPPIMCPSACPNAESAAETTNDTRRRNAIASTIPSESTRLPTKFLNPPCSGSGSTSQARLRDFWSWPNAPVAPKISAAIPPITDATPPLGAWACCRMVRTCCPPAGPITLLIWDSSVPRTSSGLSTAPSSIRMKISRGGSENTV